MSNDKSTVRVSGGVGPAFLLFLLFLGLKLGGVINWSWWWVTSPLWISFGISLVFLVLFMVIMLIAAFVKK